MRRARGLLREEELCHEALAGVRLLAEAEQAQRGPQQEAHIPAHLTQPSDTPCSGLGKPSSGGCWPQASLPSDW